ncbi:hypothetical protein M422DRAFT_27544 [Sphaerobolus stellatus SS14]|nr:hypothetical protein M422DRAFT_27544 [Sphaerobolus stellatus SS14]
MAFAVVAARNTFPNNTISESWIAVGHSEGGLSAWATNEREVTNPIGGFLGSVAIAPALDAKAIIKDAVQRDTKDGALQLFAAYVLAAVARLNSQSSKSVETYIRHYITEPAWERLRLLDKHRACLNTGEAIFRGLSFRDTFKDMDWLDSNDTTTWRETTAVFGAKPLAQPMLVLSGFKDEDAPLDTLEPILQRYCMEHKNKGDNDRNHDHGDPDTEHDDNKHEGGHKDHDHKHNHGGHKDHDKHKHEDDHEGDDKRKHEDGHKGHYNCPDNHSHKDKDGHNRKGKNGCEEDKRKDKDGNEHKHKHGPGHKHGNGHKHERGRQDRGGHKDRKQPSCRTYEQHASDHQDGIHFLYGTLKHSKYPGMDHLELLWAAQPEITQWISDRFAGREIETWCEEDIVRVV